MGSPGASSRGDYRPSRVLAGVGVYVAARTGDVDRVRRVQRMIRVRGGHVTFDWTGREGEIRSDWSAAPERARALSRRERQAVIDAHLTILCWRDEGGCGALIETGIALGQGRPVIVLGASRDSVFWYLREVSRINDERHLAAALDAWPGVTVDAPAEAA